VFYEIDEQCTRNEGVHVNEIVIRISVGIATGFYLFNDMRLHTTFSAPYYDATMLRGFEFETGPSRDVRRI